MKTYFSTPELQMIRQQVEASEKKEEELERQIEEREYSLTMRSPAAALQKPAPVYKPHAAKTYAAPVGTSLP